MPWRRRWTRGQRARHLVATWRCQTPTGCLTPGHARERGGPASLQVPDTWDWRLLRMHRHGQGVLVAPAFVGDALAEGPDAALEMQRDQRQVVERDLRGLLQQLLALVRVDRHDGLLVHLVELGIREAAVVAGAQAAGRVERRHPQLEQR